MVALALSAPLLWAADWPAYGGAPGGGQYSPLTQIGKSNVAKLRQAWTFRTGELGEGMARPGKLTFQANPLVVDGRLFISTATGIVFALDPATGKQIWRHDPKVDRTQRYGEMASRGVSSRIDREAPPQAACRHTIFIGTLDARLIALDGGTGTPCAAFGNGGAVSLREGIRIRDPGDYMITSPPAIVGNVVVVGSAIGDNRAVELERGIVRGYDAKSGRQLWMWDPIARAGDGARGDWSAEQAARASAANAWAPLAADPVRGLVFVPTGSASPDFYGGERLGANRDANSLVALKAATGEVAWRQQLVHHDLWDFDLPAQPVLTEIEVDEQKRAVVIQATKTGFVFVFDRETGEPVFPISEQSVPGSDVAGEQAWPTQPFPEAVFQLARVDPVTREDAWGFTPFDEWACRRKIGKLRSEGVFTPPSVRGSIVYPGYVGGVNWGGVAVDPVKQVLYAPVLQLPMVVTLLPKDPGNDGLPASVDPKDHPDSQFARMSGTPYAMRREALLSPFGAPCTAPPWGKLVALDLANKRRLWERGTGTTAEIAPIALDLGVPFMGGAIVTGGGLIFMAGTTDNMLRAYDQDTGDVLWETKLPAGGNATPSTYMVNGKQYLVIAAGGHGALGTKKGDHVLAFALP